MASPAAFGRLDPGGARRVRWMLTLTLVAAMMVGTIGLVRLAWADVALAVTYGMLSGSGVLQYGYVRDAYPEAVRGRALSLFTMAMFLGISLMQWASRLAARRSRMASAAAPPSSCGTTHCHCRKPRRP